MEDYQNKIRQLKDEALVEYKAGSIDKAIIVTIRSWDALPEPKYEKPDSYLIARSMVFLLNKTERYDEALVWAQHLMQSSPDRYDSGDREFMAGTVLYHIGRKDDAWMYFDVANDKSESRCFESTDTIYREFFESRDGKILNKKSKSWQQALSPTSRTCRKTDRTFLNESLTMKNLKKSNSIT